MTELRIGDQTIRFDRDRTAAVYESLEHGFADECDCLFCKNFVAQRHLVYPESFRALLAKLGLDPNKEGESFESGRVEDGCHLYGGWFYFVGEIVTAGERTCSVPGSHHFQFFFTAHPSAAAFRDEPVLALEFEAHLKWVLAESAESGRPAGHHGQGSGYILIR